MQEIIQKFLQEASETLARMDAGQQARLAEAAGLLIDAFKRGGAVYVCGNGGSAADAQHIAAELAGRFLRERPALACSALSTNTSVLTALGNDYSYDCIFARQVEAYARPGDILWAISTSGNSKNVLEAVRSARQKGAAVLGFTGGEGGQLPGLCDVCFVAPAETTYAIQQLHQVAYHILCDLVERAMA
ncbi:MAG: D-sedoheptulose 7-phosphate isomerase [Phycisphaerae bacterium]|nr:D-sedoheptulose 7-phosphate isomerase [Phycisphaerae bacterium]